MPVYVLDVNGQPLMPTHRSGKVRRLLKKVQYKGIEYFVWGRRTKGCFVLKTLDNTLSTEVTYKKLKFVEPVKTYLTERREAVFSHD